MQRLKSRIQFQAVLDVPPEFRTKHFVLHRLELEVTPPGLTLSSSCEVRKLFLGDDRWIGAVIPKRHARRATTRNTIKRQIFNLSKQAENALPKAAFVVRLRLMFDKRNFFSATSPVLKKTVHSEISHLFKQATSKAEEIVL